jgi:prophage regulatory protein
MQSPVTQSAEDRLLALPEVSRATTLSRTTIWRSVKAGTFPKPVQVSARRVAWPASGIQQWVAGRMSGGRER